MPRTARIDSPGFVHHVIIRGVNRCDIFADNVDRNRFLVKLALLAGGSNNRIYAFSLMPNHIHLLIRTIELPLASLMRHLLTGYAVYFNNRHKRVGHLFQNRYKSIVVEGDAYLLELIRYVHLNPIRARLISNVEALERWPFSGHATLMGRVRHSWLDAAFVLNLFDDDYTAARDRLKAFMHDGLRNDRSGIKAPGNDVFGNEAHSYDAPGNDGLRSDRLSNDKLAKTTRARESHEKPWHGAEPSLESTQKHGAAPSTYNERTLRDRSFLRAIPDTEITVNDGQRFMGDGQRPIDLQRLLAGVAFSHGMTVTELCSGSRRRSVVRARTEAVNIAVRQHGISVHELAEQLRVHPSTIYAILIQGKGS